MGFRNLRVINEEKIATGRGFPNHGHQDMEVITYMISCALEYKDSMGNCDVIRPGKIQHMSVGSGIRHSECNASDSAEAHVLQIWIEPGKNGIVPEYTQNFVRDAVKSGKLDLMSSPEGKWAALKMHADALLYTGILFDNQEIEHPLEVKKHAWVQIVSGELLLNVTKLQDVDSAAFSEESVVKIRSSRSSDFLLFELN